MTKEQKIEIREFLMSKGFVRTGYTSATRDAQRYAERWVSKNGDEVIMLHWKIKRRKQK